MRLVFILLFSISSKAFACKHYGECIMMKDFRQRMLKKSSKFKRNITKTKTNPNAKSVKKKKRIQNDDIIYYAKSFIGIPYRYGGEDLDGIDCSAFVRRVYKKMGIDLPRTSRQQYSDQRFISVRKENLKEGDLLFFRKTPFSSIGHVAIYIGDQRIIHSSSSEGGVYISIIEDDNIWGQQFYAARRILK